MAVDGGPAAWDAGAFPCNSSENGYLQICTQHGTCANLQTVMASRTGAPGRVSRALAALGLMLVSAGCVRSPEREQAPVLKSQAEPAVARLLPGVWKLQTVDGEPAAGWLIFSDDDRGRLLTFTLICGWQDGSYTLQGNAVRPAHGTSAGPDCSPDAIARSTIRVPTLLHHPFQVNVGARWLIARGRGRDGSTWARYVRSSPDEMRNEMLER